jgi:hypothetical protein
MFTNLEPPPSVWPSTIPFRGNGLPDFRFVHVALYGIDRGLARQAERARTEGRNVASSVHAVVLLFMGSNQ